MAISFQQKNYQLAEELFNKTINCINSFKVFAGKIGLRYASYFYRSRWLEKLMLDKPEELLKELTKINNILNRIRAENPNLALPQFFYLPDGRLFIMVVRRY